MASPLSSWPNPETLSHCFALVRWMHSRGIFWSGTVTDLAAQLSTESDAKPWFSSGEELLSFLEENTDMLSELGLDASVRRIAGRPRIVHLQINAAKKSEAVVARQSGPVEVIPPPPSDEPQIELPPDPIAAIDEPQAKVEIAEESKAQTEKVVETPQVDSSSDPADRLYALLGIEGKHFVPSAPATFAEHQRSRSAVGSSAEGFLENFRPLLIGAALLLVLAILMIAFYPRNRGGAAEAPTVIETPAQLPPVANLEPQEVKKTKALLQQASASRLAVPQYELGTRYADGLGIARDYAAAYAWLSVAKANGSTRADASLRSVGAKLSPSEMQHARIIIGKTFVDGVIVPRSFVIAHHWFAIAELAGSAEAKTLKKQLEARMSSDQIRRASAQSGSR